MIWRRRPRWSPSMPDRTMAKEPEMALTPKNTGQLSTVEGARHARIAGVGGYRPEQVITNEEVCTWIDSSDQWIRERSGIVTRRFAAEDETVVDMAAAAAGPALEMAGVQPEQIDGVVFASITHNMRTPAAAP